MGIRPEKNVSGKWRISPTIALMVFLVIALAVVAAAPANGRLASGQSISGQSAAQQSPAAQPPPSQWEIDAGGKMAFDVASVKVNKLGFPPSGPRPTSNVPMGPQDAFKPTGGLLSATNWPLIQYMIFAYKLSSTEIQSVRSQLPKWTATEAFDIEARASGNPTKDQFRLMM